MSECGPRSELILNTSLPQFFHESLNDVLARQREAAQPETVSYLVNLLVSFLHTSRLFDAGSESRAFRPLALRYADTLGAMSPEQRTRSLRELGDIALFVAGVFAESLNRKVVDVDYYAAMGGSAYARLADDMCTTQTGKSFKGMFEELSEKFVFFADALGEVAEHPDVRHHRDILRLYERWLKTGSRRAADRLRHLGIEPNATISRSSH